MLEIVFTLLPLQKGWFLALKSQAFPKWLVVFTGMPDVVMCHNTKWLHAPGRGVAASEGLGDGRRRTICRLWSTLHALCHWNWEPETVTVKWGISQGNKWAAPQMRFVPSLGQGHLSRKSRLCMLSAFPSSSSSLTVSSFSSFPSETAEQL